MSGQKEEQKQKTKEQLVNEAKTVIKANSIARCPELKNLYDDDAMAKRVGELYDYHQHFKLAMPFLDIAKAQSTTKHFAHVKYDKDGKAIKHDYCGDTAARAIKVFLTPEQKKDAIFGASAGSSRAKVDEIVDNDKATAIRTEVEKLKAKNVKDGKGTFDGVVALVQTRVNELAGQVAGSKHPEVVKHLQSFKGDETEMEFVKGLIAKIEKQSKTGISVAKICSLGQKDKERTARKQLGSMLNYIVSDGLDTLYSSEEEDAEEDAE